MCVHIYIGSYKSTWLVADLVASYILEKMIALLYSMKSYKKRSKYVGENFPVEGRQFSRMRMPTIHNGSMGKGR